MTPRKRDQRARPEGLLFDRVGADDEAMLDDDALAEVSSAEGERSLERLGVGQARWLDRDLSR